MARKTKKYNAACKVLGIDPNSDLPHAALYGTLALHGYVWHGGGWTLGEEHRASASIRVSALPNYITQIAEGVEHFLNMNGAEVTSVKGPYSNQNGKQQRIYINFRHPKEW